MKLKIDRDVLREGLRLVGKAVNSGLQAGVYDNVHLHAAGGELLLAATDLEHYLTVALPAEVEEPGCCLVPHKRLLPVVNATPDDVIVLCAEDCALEVESLDGRIRLLGEEAEQFPEAPPMPEDCLSTDPAELAHALECVMFACGDQGRYALDGVLFDIDGGRLTLVGGDGARLAVASLDCRNPSGVERRCIIQRAGAALLAALISYADGAEPAPVHIGWDGNNLFARAGLARLICRLLEGAYPAYAEVIPDRETMELPSEPLRSAVARAAGVTHKEARTVEMSLAEGTLTITAACADVGDAEVRLEVGGEGAWHVMLNPDYVLEMLRATHAPAVHMGVGDDRHSPVLFRAGPGFSYVVSPIMRDS